MYYVMVLADGETYTAVEGCRIVAMQDHNDELHQGRTIADFEVKECNTCKALGKDGHVNVKLGGSVLVNGKYVGP